MGNEQHKGRVAQPADEEIKVHGDQLAKEVDAAAGKTPPQTQVPQNTRKGDTPHTNE